MSKSLGNLVFVSDLLKTADPRAIRLALMQPPLPRRLRVARHRPRRGHRAPAPPPRRGRARDGADPRPFAARVRAAIDDDLDAPQALEALDDLASAVLSGGDDPTAPETLRELGALLGIDLIAARRRPAITDGVGPSSPLITSAGPWQITITLPDGSTRDYEQGRHRRRRRRVDRPGPGQGRARRRRSTASAGTTSSRPIDHDADRRDRHRPTPPTGREVLRHSTAHVMAQAVTDLFPGAKYAIGPAIADGFYYDFELPDGAHFTDDDLERIEARMREIVQGRRAVRARGARPRARPRAVRRPALQARDHRAGRPRRRGGDRRAAASISRLPEPTRAVDGSDEFVDLCRGPHVPSTKRLGAFKLTKVAGAYWRGDEKRPMLQRIYGTAWESKAALDEHLHRLEEAEKRDHRKLGAELDLFSFPDEIGSGLAVFHPKGGTIRRVMEDYSRQRHEAAGYEFVNSPHITKANLFETSGHLDWFADGMYPPMELDGGTEYYLKPMNCPFHILIYQSRMRSYRELPLRLFEFGTVYRYEKSGVVHGLTRVRGMTQDDAHIFCTEGADGRRAARRCSSSCSTCCATTASTTSTSSSRPSREGKAVGTDEEWEEATEALRTVAEADGPRARDGRGRRRVLRPEDLGAGHGRDRPHLADVDDPARLPAAAALRAGVRRRRQRAPPADHDPPRAVRLDRALLRDPRSSTTPARSPPGSRRCRSTVLPGRRPARRLRARDSSSALRADGFRVEVVDAHADTLGARIRRAKLEKVPVRARRRRRRRRARHRRREPRGEATQPERGVARRRLRRRASPPTSTPASSVSEPGSRRVANAS